jgi:hypothetical protein
MLEPTLPLDLCELASTKYAIEVGKPTERHKSDSIWLSEIKGKHGFVRTHSARELSVTCTSRRLFSRLSSVPTARVIDEYKDKIVIAFSPTQIDYVCDLIKPYHFATCRKGI